MRQPHLPVSYPRCVVSSQNIQRSRGISRDLRRDSPSQGRRRSTASHDESPYLQGFLDVVRSRPHSPGNSTWSSSMRGYQGSQARRSAGACGNKATCRSWSTPSWTTSGYACGISRQARTSTLLRGRRVRLRRPLRRPLLPRAPARRPARGPETNRPRAYSRKAHPGRTAVGARSALAVQQVRLRAALRLEVSNDRLQRLPEPRGRRSRRDAHAAPGLRVDSRRRRTPAARPSAGAPREAGRTCLGLPLLRYRGDAARSRGDSKRPSDRVIDLARSPSSLVDSRAGTAGADFRGSRGAASWPTWELD